MTPPGVIHIAPSVGPKSFGIGAVVSQLARAQVSLGLRPEIWCADSAEDVAWAQNQHSLPAAAVRSHPAHFPSSLCYSPQLESLAAGPAGAGFAIVHQHGIWTAISRATKRWSIAHKRPAVIAPHGSLEPYVLRRSRLKKRLALWAYERANLTQAACLHALSRQEIGNLRDFGLKNPIALIHNGVDPGWLNSSGDGEAFRNRHALPGQRILLFLSRITPKKGLPMLLEAWSENRSHLRDWLLAIAGADELGHEAEVKSQAASLGLTRNVRFLGPLFGPDKRDAFAAADALVLPTHSEGAPMVILEALGAALPVLTTTGAPWEDLLKFDCGWWVDATPQGVAEGLRAVAGAERDTLRKMGNNGKELVSRAYSWDLAAKQTASLYGWLLGTAPCPPFVER